MTAAELAATFRRYADMLDADPATVDDLDEDERDAIRDAIERVGLELFYPVEWLALSPRRFNR